MPLYHSGPAKYARMCNNGHPINPGDIIGTNPAGTIVCVLCFEPKKQETLYSNKFCDQCFLELPLAGGPCQNCG